MTDAKIYYQWRMKNKRTGRWLQLRWTMTEADAAEWARTEGEELERVEGSGETRSETGQGGPSPEMMWTPGKQTPTL